MSLRRLAIAALAVALEAWLVPAIARAEPTADSLPSFAESPGCGGLDGARGPQASRAGAIPLSAPVYGPWGDFYGRTMQLVASQTVTVRLPNGAGGLTKALTIHERVLPAFEAVIANLEAEAAKGNTYRIWDNQAWSMSAYTIPPRRAFSFHAVGAAIDINSTQNPYRSDNVLVTTVPRWFADAWRDAGWCWGGDWQTIKDPMHFAWMGPMRTPGYVTPPPQPPLVGAADFLAELPVDPGLPTRFGSPDIVADVDRDGAVDVVRIETLPGGRVALRGALARTAFEACRPIAVTDRAPARSSGTAFLEDLSSDGRADLVYTDRTGPTLGLEVFAMTHGEAMTPFARSTAIPVSAGDVHLFDDHDRDGDADLYVVRPGALARLEVWLGPDFDTPSIRVTLGVGSEGHRFDVADRDFDGIPDLYAVADDGVLVVHSGARGFSASPPVATGIIESGEFSLHDLDGDGHPDAFVVSGDGSITARRGGLSAHHPGVWYEVPEYPWTPGEGCGDAYPTCDGEPATVFGTDDDDRLWGSPGRNVVWGGDGDDWIVTLDGPDLVCAGPGDDLVEGGQGRDVLRGSAGDDVLRGGIGKDRLYGDQGADALYGDDGRDRLIGGTGPDWLGAGNGTDVCRIDSQDLLFDCEV